MEIPGGNWTAHIETTATGFRFTHRFRYYAKAPKGAPFSGDDEKRWFSADIDNTTLTKVLTAVGAIVTQMKALPGTGACYELIRGAGTVEDFVKQLLALPFACSQQVSPEEYERLTS
jgi:hypothetical protein